MKPEPITAKEYSDRIRARHTGMFDMPWGLSIHRGWGPIIEEAMASLERIVQKHGGRVAVHDVKQKLGGLRISMSYAREPELWVTCPDPGFWRERSEGRLPVDGKFPAFDFAVGRALAAGEPLWRREADGGFVDATEEARRFAGVYALLRAVVEDAVGKASRTCEFCGEPGQVDRSVGYIAVACPAHTGSGQPMMRGDEFAVDAEVEAALREARATEAVPGDDGQPKQRDDA